VLLREPVNRAFPVLIRASRQIARHADIQRAVGFTRENVHVAGFGQRTR